VGQLVVISTIVYLSRFLPSSKFDNWTRNQKYSVLGKPKYTETLIRATLDSEDIKLKIGYGPSLYQLFSKRDFYFIKCGKIGKN
jgi:hypothetical protein